MSERFSITNKTKGKLPRLPFELMKNRILGKSYLLSLVIVGKKTAQHINKQYRGKDYPTDILSFSLTPHEGEIVICPDVAKRKAKEFEKSYNSYIGFLFIHGLYHLKGLDHGEEMEALEKKMCAEFGI